MDFINELNENQREAVVNTEGPTLVIAGAGSGKTRVLTYRIANLLSKGVPAYRILALTFTNKAAREMQKRIATLVGQGNASNLWMGTFHSIFSKILRVEAEHLGYTSNFTIYDSQDSKNLIKSIVKDLRLDDKVYKPNDVLGRISMAKNNLVVAQAYAQSAKIVAADQAAKKPMITEIYKYYQLRCRQSDVMDFDDLLLQTNILFRDFPEILEKYQKKFDYILVDEYQDTNYSQYLIIKKLAEQHKNICVVGDDAQSIYSFRGARIENILNFRNDYPGYKLCKLEQNYRSTTTIVDAANSIISRNKEQIPKKTFSENEEGDKIRVMKAMSDKEEGFQVAQEIFRISQNEQAEFNDFAILYRTNAQSRIMEEALRKRNIPYKIYGGLSFYQRKEIKDLLAYLRLTVNQNDEEALKRIINYPKRGIGDTTVDKLKEVALKYNASIWTVLCNLNKVPGVVSAATAAKLTHFRQLIEGFTELAKEENAYDTTYRIAKTSGIIDDLSADDTPEGVSRKENIQELLNAVKDFSETAYNEGRDDKLPSFLEGVALLTDQDSEKPEDNNKVTLMTIHSAKGLEFENVFIVGMEEDLFPAQQSAYTPAALEEERRLFYVALTRAEKKVVMTYATTRYKNGNVVYPQPSRFIAEIDPVYLEGFFTPTRSREDRQLQVPGRVTRMAKPTLSPQPNVEIPDVDTSRLQAISGDTVVPGMIIYHPNFGAGKVITLDGLGVNKKAKVLFAKHGQKVLLLKFAKLYVQGDTN
ncbi:MULTISPECIES: ATP-dependent helicase [Butyricimonas]|uniref:ATP-dependent helicase n=1 Tax=Butyricimonas TaxID=574697 RepID=UPI001D093611|nr:MULTISPECIES: UvrD-helicase domain-containing protein [Butyricimonas]MCB6972755.1 UvrD-helicase domain-containing protein [Butyricimonas synergistica]MCG4519763.1 UvrD-helicase domain-containing protein [Butyricimonas sp. DFI.6.44]